LPASRQSGGPWATTGPESGALQAVMDLLIGPFGYSYGSIYLGEALGGSPTNLRMGAQHGYDEPIDSFDGTKGVIGRVMRTSRPALVPDVNVDPDYIGAASALRSEVCVPLVAADELLEIVNVESDQVVLDERDLDMVRLVADRLASALTLARERRSLAERAQLFHAYDRRSYPAATAAARTPDVMASLAVPLLRDQVVVGALTLNQFDASHRFSELELEVVQILGAKVALAIINADLHAEVMEASIRDSLTGAFNRRHFEPSLERMIAARRRLPVAERPPLAASMFDLDEFGSFNKFHGHQTGDAVLRAFGKLILERFRAGDLVARYGGEEFMAILEGTSRATPSGSPRKSGSPSPSSRSGARPTSGFRPWSQPAAPSLDPTTGWPELLGARDVGLAMAKGAGRN
jgi:GGDEF domain-containing protein/putative methionine-R-sulfoxide reductase with GAF domain